MVVMTIINLTRIQGDMGMSMAQPEGVLFFFPLWFSSLSY